MGILKFLADKSKLEIYEVDLEHIYEDPNGVQQVKSINQLESLKNVFFRWEDQKLYKCRVESLAGEYFTTKN